MVHSVQVRKHPGKWHLTRLPALSLQFLHLVRIFLLDPLDRLVPVVFHHSLLFEVFHLVSPVSISQSIKCTK